jgi:hypothetical protein
MYSAVRYIQRTTVYIYSSSGSSGSSIATTSQQYHKVHTQNYNDGFSQGQQSGVNIKGNNNHAAGHTADYWFGYKIGQEDGRAGVFDIGSSCDSAPNHNFEHCAAGYSEGYNSVCGNLNTRSNRAC